MALGLSWGLTHQYPFSGYDLNRVPFSEACWGTGAVLLLLRLHPALSWLSRSRRLDRAVRALQVHALTVYLWSNPAIFLSAPLAHLLTPLLQ